MTVRTVFRVMALLIVTAMPTFAEDTFDPDVTAEMMLELCEGTVSDAPADVQSLVCTFRIQGVLEVMWANCLASQQGYLSHPAFTASPPRSNRASRQAFINYMRAYPQIWDDHWSQALMLAISDTFPCVQADN